MIDTEIETIFLTPKMRRNDSDGPCQKGSR